MLKMYAVIPITKDSMLSLAKNNIFLPFDFYLCRPHIRVQSSAVTYTVSNSSVTHIKSSTVDQGSHPVKSQERYIVRYKVGSTIVKYEYVFNAGNAHAKRIEKTTNKFFDPLDQIDNGHNYFSIKNKKYGKGEESLMVVLCKFARGGDDLGNKNLMGAYKTYGDTSSDRWLNVNFFRTSVMFGLKSEYEIRNSRRLIREWNSSRFNYLMALGRYARYNHSSKLMSMLIKGNPFLKEYYEPQKF